MAKKKNSSKSNKKKMDSSISEIIPNNENDLGIEFPVVEDTKPIVELEEVVEEVKPVVVEEVVEEVKPVVVEEVVEEVKPVVVEEVVEDDKPIVKKVKPVVEADVLVKVKYIGKYGTVSAQMFDGTFQHFIRGNIHDIPEKYAQRLLKGKDYVGGDPDENS